jgi:septin family protein
MPIESTVIVENGVKLRLNVIDTPGYGDQVNNDNCWDPIIKYIKDQHSAYLRKELTAMRDRYIVDTRIHCCLFFINPTGHSLRAIDVAVLKKLSDVVNVVPVIAKSDSLTLEERALFKERIREEMEYNNIRLYPFDDVEHEEEERELNEQIRVSAVEQYRCAVWLTLFFFLLSHSFLSLLWEVSAASLSMERLFAGARRGMESSMSKMRITASLSS